MRYFKEDPPWHCPKWLKEKRKENKMNIPCAKYSTCGSTDSLVVSCKTCDEYVPEITIDMFVMVADHLNSCFGCKVTEDEIKQSNLPKDLLQEIAEESFTDTNIREQIMDHISMHYVGLPMPTYGDSEEVTDAYFKKATQLFPRNKQ